jgi:hypothetical protein
MTTKLIVAFLAFVALVVPTSAMAAGACIVADPSGTPLNVRKAPNGPIVGALNNGILVVVRDRRGDWVNVVPHEAAGKSGWVFRDYLDCSESTRSGAAAGQDRVCRGLLTANWTEGVADNTPDDGTRLIRAVNVNDSCLFHKDSDVGRKIMRACRMGYGCEVRARVNGEDSDVYNILRVYSVKGI